MEKGQLLKAEHISKSFGATKAVVDFSIEINKGEIRGFIGENGSGKSTFSNMVAGLLKPDSGDLYLRGEKYSPISVQDAAEHGVAQVVQEIGTIGNITVAANIFVNKEKLFLKNSGIDFRRMNEEAIHILNAIGGEHIAPEAKTASLNLEDRKLVEIARSMYGEPDLLIIDETSNALSKHGRDILYQNISAVKERGGSVLFITHDLDELIRICDSVTIMRDGHFVKTLYGEEMEPKVLKQLMVGREIQNNYYRPDSQPDYREEVVLEAEGLTAVGVENVSFSLHRGEILGIGGLAECGMHELGKLLFGLTKPDKGTVTLTKNRTQIKNPRQAIKNRIGYMSKNRDTEALILRASIRDNICLPSLPQLAEKLGFIHPQKEGELTEQWAGELSIKCADTWQFCNELSGGNKQKVVLAKWMGNGSEILIMDCPTRGIDIGVKEAIYKLMMRFKKEGRSMIMISEEMPELIGMSDRILVMKDSQISGEIMRSPAVTEHDVIGYMI